MTEKTIIAFDIDGCITDHRVMGEKIKAVYPTFDYNTQMTLYNLQDNLLKHGYVDKIDKELLDMLFTKIIDKTSNPTTPLTEGFLPFYTSVKDHFKVIIVSARKNTKEELEKTYKLLELNNIPIDRKDVYHLDEAKNKQVFLDNMGVKILFEDNYETMCKFALKDHTRLGYLINTPYNENRITPQNVKRNTNFTQIFLPVEELLI